MHISKSLAILLALVAASCAGQTITDRMGSYVGQPVSAVIAKLGSPMAEQTVSGRKVYIWTTNGFVEGKSFGCKIRIISDAWDVITSGDFEGNEGDCADYASRLR